MKPVYRNAIIQLLILYCAYLIVIPGIKVYGNFKLLKTPSVGQWYVFDYSKLDKEKYIPQWDRNKTVFRESTIFIFGEICKISKDFIYFKRSNSSTEDPEWFMNNIDPVKKQKGGYFSDIKEIIIPQEDLHLLNLKRAIYTIHSNAEIANYLNINK